MYVYRNVRRTPQNKTATATTTTTLLNNVLFGGRGPDWQYLVLVIVLAVVKS